jgi:5'-3' exonuclease
LKWIANKYGIPGDRYGLFAMIRGDASDGLPGIRGIGEKGAAAIATTFSSMDSVISAAREEDDRLHPTHRKKILADLSYAQIAERLVLCASDIKLPKVDLSIPKQPANPDYLQSLKVDYGLGASVDRLFAALGWS